MTNKEVIEKFYVAFKERDAKTMISCYHKDLEFEDPVFGPLDYEHASAMWRMLCDAGKDLKIEYKNTWAVTGYGGVDWEAKYTFSKTGRPVHNIIDAKFKFKDGLIVGHRDYFNLYKWSRMAFGGMGILLGWTKSFQKKVSESAHKSLARYIKEH